MEQLIEKVRRRPVLYNTSHPDYMKKSLKDSLWQKISEELKYEDGAQVKSLWLKLRNCHRDALRRKELKNKSGSATTTYKNWKYERQMEFLMRYMVNRTTTGNVQDSTNEPQENETRQTEDLQLMEYSALKDTQDTMDDSLMYTENHNDNTFEIRVPPPDSSKKQKKTNSNMNDMLAETLKRHEERAKERAARRQDTSNNKNNELYHFYMSMYGITKQLPISSQIKIKRKIFNVVTEEQERP